MNRNLRTIDNRRHSGIRRRRRSGFKLRPGTNGIAGAGAYKPLGARAGGRVGRDVGGSFSRSAINADDDLAGRGVGALGFNDFGEGGGSDGFGGGDGGGDGGGAVGEGRLVGVSWRSSREGGGRNEQRCRGDGRCLEGEAVEDGAAGGEAGSTDGCRGKFVLK